jgi:uncharacterized protein YndB with AHSA1/START domain
MTHPIGDPFGREREARPTTRSIQASIEIAATPDVVFHALADPHELVAWLGDTPVRDASHASRSVPSHDPASEERDTTSPSAPFAYPRDGASWLAHVRAPDGTPGTVSGEFLYVVPPRSLTTTWAASWNRFVQDEVTFELAPADVAGVAGTRVTVTHRQRSHMLVREATNASARTRTGTEGDAWPARLARLATYVATTNALSCCGIASEDDFTQAFDALHRRVVAIHQGDSA